MLMWIINPATMGMVRDLPAPHLAPNIWTSVNNVDCVNGTLQKSEGLSTYLNTTVPPYGIIAHKTATESVFAYMGLAKVYGFTNSTHLDITRTVGGDYTGTAQDLWQGTSFNDWVILNNGVDVPQAWGTPPDPAIALANLVNWPASTTARVLRAIKNFLVAIDITESGVRYPRMVRWSHSAAPGVLPTSWDHTDATKDAGRVVLSESDERLIDAIRLGEVLVLYSENTTTAMQFVGGFTRFAFRTVFDRVGILAQQCASQIGRSHFLVTLDDIVMHSLSGDPETIIDQRNRSWFFANVNPAAYFLTKVVKNSIHREVWVLFPGLGSTVLNMALVWNFRLNTWTVAEIPNAYAATEVISLATSQGIWDGDTGTWDSDTSTWDVLSLPAYIGSLFLASPSHSKIFVADATVQKNGVSFISTFERSGFPYLPDRNGQPVLSFENRKQIQAVWPLFEADSGTKIKVEVGSHNNVKEAITWQAAKDFTVGTDVKVDLYAEGRYLAVRYTDYGGSAWKFLGHGLDVEPMGKL